MNDSQSLIERARSASTSAELRDALGVRRPVLSLPDVLSITRRLSGAKSALDPLRLAVLSTYTTELTRPWLEFEALVHGFDLNLYLGPYGATREEALDGSGLREHQAEILVLLLRLEDLDPRLGTPLISRSSSERSLLLEACLDQTTNILSALSAHASGCVVVNFLPRFHQPEAGISDAMEPGGERAFLHDFESSLAAALRESFPSVSLLSSQSVLEEVGRRAFFDMRMWHVARHPFSPASMQVLSRMVFTHAVILYRPKAKVIALDADNTLWGGIAGEDGIHGIKLGPEHPGSVYLAFQRRLLDFQARGFVLVLCSRNNWDDVVEVLDSHPHMLLRRDAFAAMRINWEPKHENLSSLAEELNVSLDSFTIVDDSPHECHSIASMLPSVRVVRVPEDPFLIPSCLDEQAHLEVPGLTSEDRDKTRLYATERKRKELRSESGSHSDYLRSLDMVLEVSRDDASQIPRLSQLTQKTNQFNLTTRRYTEADMRVFVLDERVLVAQASLQDIFGHSGTIGLAIVRFPEDRLTAKIDTFLLSCRVLGRSVERAFLMDLLDGLAESGCSSVTGEYCPTEKNSQVSGFWLDNGFERIDDHLFRLSFADWKRPIVDWIRIAGTDRT